MSVIRKFGDFELADHRAFQHWEWRLQRAGWFLLIGIVIAGLAGVLGSGPLSSTQAVSRNGELQVSYDRFLHRSQSAAQRIQAAGSADGMIRLHVDAQFLRHVRVLRISPQPEVEVAGSRGTEFVIRKGSPADAPSEIVVHFEPEEAGSLPGEFSLAQGAAVHTSQFVYP